MATRGLYKFYEDEDRMHDNKPTAVIYRHWDNYIEGGGIDLKEINFKTMESKIHPNLYFAGEIVNIDAITGGFNFQNAWTTGHLAGTAAAGKTQG